MVEESVTKNGCPKGDHGFHQVSPSAKWLKKESATAKTAFLANRDRTGAAGWVDTNGKKKKKWAGWGERHRGERVDNNDCGRKIRHIKKGGGPEGRDCKKDWFALMVGWVKKGCECVS